MSATNRLGKLLFVVGLGLLVPAETSPQEQNPEEGIGEVYQLREEQEIRAMREQVLSNSEYRRLAPREKPEPEEAESGWLARFWEWLERWLTSESSSSTEASESWQIPAPLLLIFRSIVYLLVAGVIAMVAILIFQAVARRSPPMNELSQKPEAGIAEVSSRPPGELASEEYLTRALSLADAADYKAAIRQLLLGTMSWIERQGFIRYRRGLSNRDYLRAVTERARLREPLHRIVVLFEQVYFGRRMATPEGFKECLKEYRKGFRTE
jgi:hypothetical protein